MRELDIGEVASRSGLSASALRYYEDQGLIRSIGRRGLRRQFDAGVLERLALIARMFADGRPRIDRALLSTKARELDATIRKLTAMRNGLRHAAACSAPSHMECPTFRKLLGAAARGALAPATRRKS